MSTPTTLFLAGFMGSCGLELLTMHDCFLHSPITFPERYKRVWFWPTRLGVAALGGLLAIAYSPAQLYLAIGLGAGTPALLKGLAATAQESNRRTIERGVGSQLGHDDSSGRRRSQSRVGSRNRANPKSTAGRSD
jgi:hypothetical protein